MSCKNSDNLALFMTNSIFSLICVDNGYVYEYIYYMYVCTTKLNDSAFYNVLGPTDSHHFMYSIINKITFCLFIVC